MTLPLLHVNGDVIYWVIKVYEDVTHVCVKGGASYKHFSIVVLAHVAHTHFGGVRGSKPGG